MTSHFAETPPPLQSTYSEGTCVTTLIGRLLAGSVLGRSGPVLGLTPFEEKLVLFSLYPLFLNFASHEKTGNQTQKQRFQVRSVPLVRVTCIRAPHAGARCLKITAKRGSQISAGPCAIYPPPPFGGLIHVTHPDVSYWMSNPL